MHQSALQPGLMTDCCLCSYATVGLRESRYAASKHQVSDAGRLCAVQRR